jgi:hypothetical protein
MADIGPKQGHRERLRKRFLSNPDSFSDSELLELILTYAIPRRDVAPLADNLLVQFGDLSGVLSASYQDLCKVDGVGEQAAILINAIGNLTSTYFHREKPLRESVSRQEAKQNRLFEVEPDLGPLFDEPKGPQMRAFVNDEIANSLQFLPEAIDFDSLDSYRQYLEENLPYNSITTRKRRVGHIINRLFTDGRIDTPLAYFASNASSSDDNKQALFYEVLRGEPLAAKVADEFIWPALPNGYVGREVMREFILRHLPDLSPASQTKVLNAIYKTYTLLSIGTSEGDLLRFQIHKGTLEGFLYVLTSEFPKPGVYSFEALYSGPMRHWLLWDKEWMRQQLYNLQDFGVIAKVSEIDTVRQFTTQLDQMNALRTYFEHPQRGSLSIRERKL